MSGQRPPAWAIEAAQKLLYMVEDFGAGQPTPLTGDPESDVAIIAIIIERCHREGCPDADVDVIEHHVHLQAAVAELREALEPFARFFQYAQAHPHFGLDPDTLYAFDGGQVADACIRWPDLRHAAAVLDKTAGAAVPGGREK